MANGVPFLLLEADIRLLVDVDGAEVWIGGCAQNLTLTDEYTDLVVQTPGVPFGKVKQVDESHEIEIENVWLLDVSENGPQMPHIERGEVYRMEITWLDADTQKSNKRVYTGVTGRAQRVGSNAMENLTYRAEQMFENKDPERVDYVTGTRRTQIYAYDPVTGFTANPAFVPDLGEILESPGQVEIFIGGTLALLANSSGVAVKKLTPTGAAPAAAGPRLAFYFDGRVASLSQAGELMAGNMHETDALDGLEGLVLKEGATRFAVLGEKGPYAAAFSEML